MSAVVTRPVPGASRIDTPLRWEQALARAQEAGIRAYQLGTAIDEFGRPEFAVTSATDPKMAYLTNADSCTCAAGQYGDPVCQHRALVRSIIAPEPEPLPPVPGTAGHDALIEDLRWAENDWKRACTDLERYNAAIERKGNLTDSEYHGFLCAQERELGAHDRILAAKAELAKVAAHYSETAKVAA